MKRWKVGITLDALSFAQTAPGTARLVEHQARALFRLDLPWDWVPVAADDGELTRDVTGGRAVCVEPVRSRSRFATFRLGRIWNEAGCDLGFATAYFVPAGRIPVVANYFDVNLFEPVDRWDRQRRPFAYWLMRALCRHSVSRSTFLFVLSEYGRQRLANLYPSHAAKFVVTPCGTEPPRTAPGAPPDWARALRKPFCLQVGAFSDNKNQAALLRAWKALQSRHADWPALVLIGPCSSAYRRAVVQPLIDALPRPGDIVIPGYVPDNDLSWAYRHAHLYLQPSIAEGFGLPIIEAMSYGLAVACSSTTSLPETAGAAALLFDPRDQAGMASQITRLHTDRDLRLSLATSGRERAATFTWDRNARLVADHIMKALETGERQARE